MGDESDTLIDALWDMMPSGTVQSEEDFRYQMLDRNHDIDIEEVDFKEPE